MIQNDIKTMINLVCLLKTKYVDLQKKIKRGILSYKYGIKHF